MSILMVGLLGLAQVFYFGMAIVGTSSAQLIAREKAREAIESVHTARDTRTITWAADPQRQRARRARPSRRRDAAGRGVTPPAAASSSTASSTCWQPGPDGLVNTADDAAPAEEMTGPMAARQHRSGTADDIPLVGVPREIAICDVNGNPNLRQIAVTIRYNGSTAVGIQRRTYTLITYISSFS